MPATTALTRPDVEPLPSIGKRLDGLPWKELQESLWELGYAVTPPILTAAECSGLRGLYGRDELFRSQVIMERLRFGKGDYKYFANPIPDIVRELRTHAYPYLAKAANEWAEALGEKGRFPAEHAAFLERCHRAGQKRPTPLLLHYEQDGYNCLHQDIYGAVAFPLQMVVLLGQRGRDWEGGEFVLVEQRPRAQSKAEVISAGEGCAVIFTTRYRPVQGARGYYRVNMKHGVARVRSGSRYTLGIIFHDAE
ncbi:MAG TPA: 2OG-Fe(II) oxygenase [Candidatus Binatia bacterium]|nr:2OG-Fe(II) oxygenase [Candidatus Binatia bacterium]